MKIQREETIKTFYSPINVWIESESTDVILPYFFNEVKFNWMCFFE